MSIQIYLLLLVLVHNVFGFVPLHQSSSHLQVQREDVSSSVPLKSAQQQEDSVIHTNDDFLNNGNEGGIRNNNLTALERIRILSYRTGIGASAWLTSIQALGDASFLEGTGIDVDGILSVVEQSQTCLPMAAGATILLCPVPRERMVQIGTKSFGALVLASGLLSIVTSEQTLSQSSWSLSILAFMAISIREIYYFGFEYKQECGIIMAMLPFMIDFSNRISFAVPLCGLGLSILAAGKIFEPLKEDLVRSNSEFLAK